MTRGAGAPAHSRHGERRGGPCCRAARDERPRRRSGPRAAACVRREELDLADLDGESADGSEWRPSSVKIVASSVAPVLCSTPRGAESRVADALCLVEDLPRTLAAALGGRLTPRQTGVMADRAGLVAVDGRPAFDAVVVDGDGVESLTPARLRRQCERAAMAIDPAPPFIVGRSTVLRDRFVRVEPGLDPGTTWWKASLPAGDSMQAWGAVRVVWPTSTCVPTRPGRSEQARGGTPSSTCCSAAPRVVHDCRAGRHTPSPTPAWTISAARRPPAAWRRCSQTYSLSQGGVPPPSR